MTATNSTRAMLDAAGEALAGKGAVHMVNLLRFRAEAAYGAGAAFSPCSGREAYFQRYAPAFARIAAKLAPDEPVTVAMLCRVHATIVPPTGESWDEIAIVAYPSFETLRRIVESADYLADADPHRRAAVQDWRFLATTRTELPA